MGIRLKDLSKLGYRDNVARSLVVDIVSKHCKYDTKEQIEMTLSDIPVYLNLLIVFPYSFFIRIQHSLSASPANDDAIHVIPMLRIRI